MCERTPTTDSESDSEIDAQSYEAQREENVRKMVALDRVFNRIRRKLYEARLESLEMRQMSLVDQNAVDYLHKKEAILMEYETRVSQSLALRDNRLGELRRETTAMLEIAQKNLVEGRELVHDRCYSSIMKRIQYLHRRKKLSYRELAKVVRRCAVSCSKRFQS